MIFLQFFIVCVSSPSIIRTYEAFFFGSWRTRYSYRIYIYIYISGVYSRTEFGYVLNEERSFGKRREIDTGAGKTFWFFSYPRRQYKRFSHLAWNYCVSRSIRRLIRMFTVPLNNNVSRPLHHSYSRVTQRHSGFLWTIFSTRVPTRFLFFFFFSV